VKHLYSEHNPYRAAVLRERIEDGLLPDGIVDERNIDEIPDEDFLGYAQVHLFAGIGGFPLGMRRAGFPEHIRIVDGGFPCQDISNAGKRAGITGSRSRLWREMVRCVRVVRPQLVFVENVAALLGRGMGVVLGDLAEIGYDAEGDCISAADVGAPHLRRRIWIVAYAVSDGIRDESIAERWSSGAPVAEHAGEIPDAASLRGTAFFGNESHGDVSRLLADANETRRDGRAREKQSLCGQSSLPTRFSGCGDVATSESGRQSVRGIPQEQERSSLGQPAFSGANVSDAAKSRLEGTDIEEMEDAREGRQHSAPTRSSGWPVEPDVGRVAHGIPKRVDRLAALGDAIVPQCVEEMLRRLKR
jgi:DNA (cytosine-5)-methyltransferase 1